MKSVIFALCSHKVVGREICGMGLWKVGEPLDMSTPGSTRVDLGGGISNKITGGLELSGKELYGKRWNYPENVGIIRKFFWPPIKTRKKSTVRKKVSSRH